MKGYIHSIESFSTLDGPGIRSVVFLQGCPLRCIYCHNPDTWIMENGKFVDSEYVLKSVSKNLNYISKDGGVTISGGEPTFQIDFLSKLLTGLKSMGLHTAVDTSGFVLTEDILKIIEFTDLFIVDIKHMDSKICRDITGKDNSRVFKLLECLGYYNKDVWIRNVLISGYTDGEEHIRGLSNSLKKFNNIKRFELLPYHDMAKDKYRKLNINHKLSQMPSYNYKKAEDIKLMYTEHYDGSVWL